MMPDAPVRLRLFAGPNGSGKSSLVRTLAKEFATDGKFHLHRYVNADDLQAELSSEGLDLDRFDIPWSPLELERSLREGGRLNADNPAFASVRWEDGRMKVPDCDSYVAAAVADFVRERCLAARLSFAFETVMSHQNKVDFFRRAAECGCRTYLYFVATDDPMLNVSRVESRVGLGGHAVAPDKVIARYHRTLSHLSEAVQIAHRAFLFDNSQTSPVWLAEKSPDGRLERKVAEMSLPQWFRTHLPTA